MKKGLVIVLVVAILGGLGGYMLIQNESNEPAVQASQNRIGDRSTQANNYPNGTYTSDVAETLYGNVQITIVITSGKISDVQFRQMPDKDDGRTQQLTEMSKPLLKATTLEKQSDQIDFVTGATSTSYGYQESLQSALDKAYDASKS
ncbi:MAG TPA: FMN-binding protein [Candidatus Saccharimonadales bacterium]